MRGVADKKQSRFIPPFEAVHRHRQKFDVIPIVQLSDSIGQERSDARDGLAKRLEPSTADHLEAALLDDERALIVVEAIYRDKNPAGCDVAERIVDFAGLLREAEPKHVDRRAEIEYFQGRLLSQ